MAAEAFLDWLQPKVHADLIGGEVFMHSPVSFRHARLLNFVDFLLRHHIRRHRLGELFRETSAVRLSAREVFMPDLAFYRPEQVARFGPVFANLAPPLAVEVLSPTTAYRDEGPKFAAYELHGVEEYWVLDPDRLGHRFYRRDGELLMEFAAGEEVVTSTAVPGFWLRRAWLNPEALPDELDCLGQISAPTSS